MARFKITTGEKWEYDYHGHKIVVTNGLDKCELIVDGKVQDAHNGLALSVMLTGKVDDKPIKVSMGGFFDIKCSVFVDHEQLACDKKSEF